MNDDFINIPLRQNNVNSYFKKITLNELNVFFFHSFICSTTSFTCLSENVVQLAYCTDGNDYRHWHWPIFYLIIHALAICISITAIKCKLQSNAMARIFKDKSILVKGSISLKDLAIEMHFHKRVKQKKKINVGVAYVIPLEMTSGSR